MKQEQENECWVLELSGRGGNKRAENGPEMTVLKCQV